MATGIERFMEEHPGLGPIWTPDGSEGQIVVVNERRREAGLANHVLVEIDGEVWPLKIDQALFLPQS